MIGVFDSGLGGLTALKEITRLLPHEKLIYFGDTGRVPYGTRSKETIIKYAIQDMRFLLSHHINAVVVACGTVSSTALDILRDMFDIPIIGVVEGAAESAVKLTKNGIIGVIGTNATINSNAYNNHIIFLDSTVKVVSNPCPLLVPLVENGFIERDNKVTQLVCEKYLQPIKKCGADTLILGCTHYPIIKDIISDLLPNVKIVNSGCESARKLEELLTKNNLHTNEFSDNSVVDYYVSDDPISFNQTASIFLQKKISSKNVKKIDIEMF